MTNGSREAVSTAYRLCVRSKEDGVLIPSPSYPLYEAFLNIAGGTKVSYDLNEEDGWKFNPSEIQDQIA